jgi:N-acetylmuramoyl-L-alanine amidase
VIVVAGTDRVVLTEGQSTVSAGGRLLSLSAPVTRAGTTWLVPVDFLRTLNRGIDVRRGSRLIVVAPAVVPRVTPRLEQTATGGRLELTIEPGTSTRVTREGRVVSIRFSANGVEMTPLTDAPAALIANVRVDGPSLLVDLGSGVTDIRTETSGDPARLAIVLVAAPAPSVAAPVAPPVALDRTPGIRTVVLDPGHGGDDSGARSLTGVTEKQITLAVAQRVKASLESRLGVRVVLTREDDSGVPDDRRAALANNNKADLFISLHANAGPRPDTRGAQVLSLDGAEYANVAGAAPRSDAPPLAVPIVGGGTRLIDTVPWHLAQLPHVSASASFAAVMAQRLSSSGLTMHPRPVDVGALRVLVGANMPAILIELGMLSNEDEARGLIGPEHVAAIVDAIVSAVSDVRFGVRQ